MKSNKTVKVSLALSIIVAVVGAGLVALKSPTIGMFIGLVMVATWYLVYRLIFRGPMLDKQLVATGEPAQARIVELVDTGVTINNNPQVKMIVEVRRKSGETYRAELETTISRLEIPRFQPGANIAVTVDPEDATKIALGIRDGTSPLSEEQQAAESAEAADLVKRFETLNEEVRASGSPAKALIIQVMDLSINVNGPNPAKQFSLEVQPEGQPAFKAFATGVIASGSVEKYQPGMTIFVKYDPKDRSRVTLDHS